jgi:MYXO-CTERM domain-containing protein
MRKHIFSEISSITPVRWAAYMAAATASSLVGTNSAEGDIHYSGLINQKLRGFDRAIFDLDPTGRGFEVRHFNFVYGSSSITTGGVASVYIYARSGAVNGSVSQACEGGKNCVSNLKRGEAISAGPFMPRGGTLAFDSEAFLGRGRYGQFLERGFGLIGFKFNNGAGDQYGWVRVKMLGAPVNMLEMVDYAYGDPGEPVSAGQKESNTSTPTLESLGGLALGAAGLLAWRRRRQALVH